MSSSSFLQDRTAAQKAAARITNLIFLKSILLILFLSIPSFPVRAIDGTGAGDGHIGTILSCLYKGYSLKRALSIASAVSAAIVQVEGPVLSRQQYEKLLPSFAKEEDF